MPKAKRLLPFHYLAELLILIAGITISFILNEWRIQKVEQKEQRRLVQQLTSDLQADTAIINVSLDFIERVDSVAERLCLEDSLSLSAISQSLPLMVNTVSQKFHKSTYSEMESTGRLMLIEDDSLRMKIISYYTGRMPSVYEWHSIDRDQALPEITEFYFEHFPYAYFFDYTEASREDSIALQEVIRSDEFRNQVQFNRIIKSGVAGQYERMLEEAKVILEDLGSEIQ